MKHQRGITLIETLAVITISSMILIIVYSIYVSAMKANQSSFENTNLRNEAVLICTQTDQSMLNINDIEMIGETNDNGYFNRFYAIDTGFELDEPSGEYKEITRSKTRIEITEKDFLINGKRINSERYSVKDSNFSLKNGGLLLQLIVFDPRNGGTFEVNKLYHLQSE